MFQGTLAALANKRRQNSFTVFETSDAARARQILASFGFDSRIEAGGISIPVLEPEQIAAINRKLVQNNVEVYRIGKIENDSERIFFDVIGE